LAEAHAVRELSAVIWSDPGLDLVQGLDRDYAVHGEQRVDLHQELPVAGAWKAVDDGDVETRAMQLAARAASDAELARRAITAFRAEVGPPAVAWETAVEMERGVQMWSRRRRQESL
jgi:hypothetical protein